MLPAPGLLSMVAGDFAEVYSREDAAGSFDAVVTCFFLDTAHNVIEYMEVIKHVLKVSAPFKLWSNAAVPCLVSTWNTLHMSQPVTNRYRCLGEAARCSPRSGLLLSVVMMRIIKSAALWGKRDIGVTNGSHGTGHSFSVQHSSFEPTPCKEQRSCHEDDNLSAMISGLCTRANLHWV